MHQLVGTADHPATNVRELLVSIAPRRLRDAAERMEAAEQRLADDPMAYADALAAWGDAGGYDLEVTWDECVTRAVGESFDSVAARPLRTFSGGEQKRLALEALLRSEFDILVLDEPDNFLDVPAKRWLEAQLDETPQDRPVHQPRPRTAGRHRHQDRDDRGVGRLDPRRLVRRLRRGQGAPRRPA
jgi:ATPase subunit of ABC transporter with duplicated ATPase domains